MILGILDLLEFRNAEVLGRNARKSVEKGYDRWLNQRQEIFKFITGIPQEQWDWTEVLEPKFKVKVNLNENLSLIGDRQRNRKMKFEGGKRLFRKQPKAPLLTVVTVVKNSETNIEKTIMSVLSQTFEDFEYIIIDGMSSDGTIDIVQKYENCLDYWRSEKDEGPYHAMNKAINIAKGQYIVFMNAGDWFATPYVLEKVFQNTSEESEIIYGDHIWLNNGTPNFHKSLQFSAIQGILDTGTNQVAHWYQGLPNHQSTFIKTKLLKQNPFDTKYQIAADYDFLFKMALNGASFLQIDLLISVYPSGGFSGQNEKLCHEEWRKIFKKYRQSNIANHTEGKGFSQDYVKCIISPAMISREIISGENKYDYANKDY